MTIDEENILIKQVQQNASSFEPLYNKYYLSIFYYVAKRTNNKDLAGEVTAIVFLKALENIKQFTFKSIPFSSWLFRIAHNTLIDSFRKNKTQRIIDCSSKQLESIAVESDIHEPKQRIDAILKVLPTLKTEEITLLELRYFEQRSFREVGDILQITEQSARVKTHRLIVKMKKMLNI